MRSEARTALSLALAAGLCLGIAEWMRPDTDGPATESHAKASASPRAPSASALPTRPSDVALPAEGDHVAASVTQPPSPAADSPQLGSDGGREASDEARLERSPGSLDRAPEPEIRSVLARAVEAAQRERALSVAPSVLERAASERRVRIIFDTEASMGGGALANAELAALLSGPGAVSPSESTLEAHWEDLRLFPLLGHGAALVGPQALLHLIEADFVGHIELDDLHRPSLDSSLPVIEADLAHADGYDGDGSVIALLDTGIDGSHPMYAGRILEEACFSTTQDCPNGEAQMLGPGAAAPCSFDCDHGTHVASIAAGADTGDGLVGLAPNASLIAIQIFSKVRGSPAAYSSDILAALQHVLALAPFYEIAAVNLSFGGSVYSSEESCDQAGASQKAAIDLLRQVGIASVAAAGNESFTNALTSPACLSNVISVGSVSDADEPSSFSNTATFLSLLAPGEDIETAENGGGTVVGSGTSLAAPHVSGAIAILREAVPHATVAEIENALALSGVPVVDSRNGVTTPRIRVAEAAALLATTAGSSPPSSPASSRGGSGGGGGCGLIGLEPLLVIAGVRVLRRRRPRVA